MRGHSTAASELHSSLALPNFGLVRAVIICAISRKSAESSTHRAASPQMYPHPWRFRQLGTWSVHMAKEMQAENLNAQVAAQVCMDLRGSPCFEVDVGGLWWASISLDQ